MLNPFLRLSSLICLLLALMIPLPPAISAHPAVLSDLNSLTTNVAFITTLYRDLLGRSPGPVELTNALNLLVGGTRSQLARQILVSNEYRAGLAQHATQKFLGRPATSPEVYFALGLFTSGAADETVFANILASPEYFSKAGGTNLSFLTHLYQDLLGRPADQTGLNFWSGILQGGGTRGEVATGLMTGAEYRTNALQALYLRLLHRPPTPAEINLGLDAFQAGATDEDISAALAGAPDFYIEFDVYLPAVRH